MKITLYANIAQLPGGPARLTAASMHAFTSSVSTALADHPEAGCVPPCHTLHARVDITATTLHIHPEYGKDLSPNGPNTHMRR